MDGQGREDIVRFRTLHRLGRASPSFRSGFALVYLGVGYGVFLVFLRRAKRKGVMGDN